MAPLRQTWDNSAFYTHSNDPRIATTIEDLKGAIATLADRRAPFGAYVDRSVRQLEALV